jgi:hypothetical protein
MAEVRGEAKGDFAGGDEKTLESLCFIRTGIDP